MRARHAQCLHDQRGLMGRGNGFDVVAAAFLQIEHDFCQLQYGLALSPETVGYLIVLAIDAPQVARRQENGSGPVCSGKGWLFPMMGQCAVHYNVGRQATITQFAFCPVHPAGSGTKRAGRINIEKGLNNHFTSRQE